MLRCLHLQLHNLRVFAPASESVNIWRSLASGSETAASVTPTQSEASSTPAATPQVATENLSTTDTEAHVAVKPDLVDKYLGADYLSRSEKLKLEKNNLVKAFQLREGDVGSSQVQVALLTHRIRGLEPHFKEHQHDHHSMRGLQALLVRRRRLLQYLRSHDFEGYMVVLNKLGLKDIYGKQSRLDKYRLGTKLPYATAPLKRYKQSKS